jgi:segregation and condensation protein A
MIATSHPTVQVEGFTGPFDLLVRLIERRELDVLTISLAAVTEQYLEHLATLQRRDPEHLSAFLVVAAKLLLIKSSLLLPSADRTAAGSEPAPDPTDLTERLREYQKFRRASQWLSTREDAGLRSYARPPAPYRAVHPPRRERLDPYLLREAMLRALSRPKSEPSPVEIEQESRLSVTEALAILEAALREASIVQFSTLVGERAARQRHVAIFLAILEAVRQGLVRASQDRPFGEISLSRAT